MDYPLGLIDLIWYFGILSLLTPGRLLEVKSKLSGPTDERGISMIKTYREYIVPAEGVRSLVWDGEFLVDWVSGGKRYGIDGSVQHSHARYAYSFDEAIVSPSGKYSVIYTDTGTKALLLHEGEILRQFNRDFYQANAYQYPITFAWERLRGAYLQLSFCTSHTNP